ncbi:hypothetical protein HDU76_005734 [Blyttiomyces sp. JEL0837]|nr:hypothetical protein HDU76_005734 [Blyttiomyces sp. JEL0837]
MVVMRPLINRWVVRDPATLEEIADAEEQRVGDGIEAPAALFAIKQGDGDGYGQRRQDPSIPQHDNKIKNEENHHNTLKINKNGNDALVNNVNEDTTTTTNDSLQQQLHNPDLPLWEQIDFNLDDQKKPYTLPEYLGAISNPRSTCRDAYGHADDPPDNCSDRIRRVVLPIEKLFNKTYIESRRRLLRKLKGCQGWYDRKRQHSYYVNSKNKTVMIRDVAINDDDDGEYDDDDGEDDGHDEVWEDECRPEVVVISTVCSPLFELYAKNLEDAGVKLRVLWSHGWGGFGHRLRIEHAYLRTVPSTRLTVITDALDMAYVPSCTADHLIRQHRKASETFANTMSRSKRDLEESSSSTGDDIAPRWKHPPVILGAERWIWPDKEVRYIYPEPPSPSQNRKQSKTQHHRNQKPELIPSRLIQLDRFSVLDQHDGDNDIEFMKVIQSRMKTVNNDGDDSVSSSSKDFSKISTPYFGLDYMNHVVQTLSGQDVGSLVGVYDDESLNGGGNGGSGGNIDKLIRLKNIETGGHPCFVHDNGMKTAAKLEKVLAKMKLLDDDSSSKKDSLGNPSSSLSSSTTPSKSPQSDHLFSNGNLDRRPFWLRALRAFQNSWKENERKRNILEWWQRKVVEKGAVLMVSWATCIFFIGFGSVVFCGVLVRVLVMWVWRKVIWRLIAGFVKIVMRCWIGDGHGGGGSGSGSSGNGGVGFFRVGKKTA